MAIWIMTSEVDLFPPHTSVYMFFHTLMPVCTYTSTNKRPEMTFLKIVYTYSLQVDRRIFSILVVREMQMEGTVRHRLTLLRMATIKR